MDMPPRYGSESTAHRRLQQWQRSGTWEKILDAARSAAYKKGLIKMQKASVDSTDVAASMGFDIIIIASRGYGQVKGWFLGSVANEFVHRARIPILVVK
jgi:nucleotide-binding universal stress UspA family protein